MILDFLGLEGQIIDLLPGRGEFARVLLEMSGKARVGCCGFARRMKEYFFHFDLVEVQQTFYKPPKLETAVRWREQAPGGFEFTLKAWQLITHPPSSPTYRKAGMKIPPEKGERYGFFKPTEEVREAWERTREIALALGARVIVFQCPPRFSENQENVQNLKRFFRDVERDGFRFVWEPRGNWHEERVRSLCQELDLIHCVDPFEGKMPLHGWPRYLRLHGGPGYRHKYTEEELDWLAGLAGEETYFLFNNLSMFEDALRFKECLSRRG